MKRFNQIFTVMAAMLLLSVMLFSQSSYVQFGQLNHDSVTVSSGWTKLKTTSSTHSFTKRSSSTKIEVHVNSRFTIGKMSGARGVRFQVRIDDRPPSFGNKGSILTSNTTEFLSIFSVFRKLPAGKHTVSIWAQAPGGSAASVAVDPGGWGGMMIVKETQ